MKSLGKLLIASSLFVPSALLGINIAPVHAFTFSIDYDCSTGGSGFCTLDDLITNGGSISFDEDSDGTFDKVFDNWSLSDTLIPPNLDLSAIQISGFEAGSLAAGLSYVDTGNVLSASGIGVTTVTVPFSYSLSTFNGRGVVKNDLALTDASTTNLGLATVTEVVYESTPSGTSFIGDKTVAEGMMVVPTASLSFSPQQQLVIDTTITLNTFNNTSAASITEFNQVFSQIRVPEPTSIVSFLALGTAGFLAKRRASL